jgi:VIT1/CCC1 family predicted Fe2+/Mn2+ transporter
LSLAVVILAVTTYYSTVIQARPFLRDFIEILAILFATTIALYAFGYLVRAEFPGIRVT